MRKPLAVIQLLEPLEELTAITDQLDARWLSRFALENPELIIIQHRHPKDKHDNAPYFKAILTSQGKTYLSMLRRENNILPAIWRD